MENRVDLLNNLTPKARNYIVESIGLFLKNKINLLSVIIFGSAIRGEYHQDLSDVDMIFVINDDTTKKAKNKIGKELNELEYKLIFRKRNASIVDAAYKLAEDMTGMYLSHFVCYRKDFLDEKFSKVFNLNLFLCKIFAPTDVVWASIIKSAKTLWGENLLDKASLSEVTRHQIRKSRWMNLVLCIGALLTYPLHSDATKYAMEAVKWSLQTCYLCYTLKPASTEEAVSFFNQNNYRNPIFKELLELRRNYQKSLSFVRKSFRAVAYLHKKTLKENELPKKIE